MKRFTRNSLLALVLMALAITPAAAGVFIPTKTADTSDGACTETDCSLREAIIAANASPEPDVILLHAGTYAFSRAGAGEDAAATGDLDIQDGLTLLGDGAGITVVDASSLDRVFHILAGAQVEIRDLTIVSGNVSGGDEDGGGVLNAGSLSLVRVAVTGNQAGGSGGGIRNLGADAELTVMQSLVVANQAGNVGGGIAAQGTVELANVTITQNSALNYGGGLYSFAGLDAVINNATIYLNTATLQKGGGVFAESSAFTSVDHPFFINSIIAANTAPGERDCSGAATSGGYNLLGVGGNCIDFEAAKGDKLGTSGAPLDPKLSVLGANGGPTDTLALLVGSPAIDAANPLAPGGGGNACEATDQRGVTRTGRCDIGAFEVTTACVAGANTLCLNNDRFRVTATFKPPQGAGGAAKTVEFTADSGYMTFFDPANVELTVKVLNGCSFNNRYWVFIAGMTNVEVTVTVVDTQTGATKVYLNPQGRLYRTVADTAAFTCQ